MTDKINLTEETKKTANVLAYGFAQASLADAYIEEVKKVADQYGVNKIQALVGAARCILSDIGKECEWDAAPDSLGDLKKEGGEGNEVEAD